MAEVINDGFGNAWVKCLRADCSLHIVRPGKVQCEGEYDEIGCPHDHAKVLTSLDSAIRLLREGRRER